VKVLSLAELLSDALVPTSKSPQVNP